MTLSAQLTGDQPDVRRAPDIISAGCSLTLNIAGISFWFAKFCLLTAAIDTEKCWLTFTSTGVSANQRIALAHTLPRLGLDLPVRADLDELGSDLLGDGAVANLLSLEAAVLPSKFNHAD